MPGSGAKAGTYTGIGQAATKIFKEEGLMSFWKVGELAAPSPSLYILPSISLSPPNAIYTPTPAIYTTPAILLLLICSLLNFSVFLSSSYYSYSSCYRSILLLCSSLSLSPGQWRQRGPRHPLLGLPARFQ